MLETERLLLRPWEHADRDKFRPLATDPEVMRYINAANPWSDKQIDEFISRQITRLERYGFCFWKLSPKQNPEELIGFCGIQYWHDRPGLEIGYDGAVEIGWWLARDRWGQGFASEAARTVLQHGFEHVGLDKIIAVIDKENLASQKVARRIGLHLEREIPLGSLVITVFTAERNG